MNFIKLEMHAHSRGGSSCAQADVEEMLKIYKAAGYGGIVLTNHCCEASFALYPGETYSEKLKFYFSLYEKFRTEALKAGIKPFFGSEVRAYDAEGYFSEYLLYGLDKKFFTDNPVLYKLTQKELFALAQESGVFMAQSHPFRNGVKVGYYGYLHGVEVFNGHKFHTNRNPVAKAFAEGFSFKEIAGTDFHMVEQTPVGGIYLPEEISTDKELAEYLFSSQPQLICQTEK